MKIYSAGILLLLCASWIYTTKAVATAEVETQTIASQNMEMEFAESNTMKATTLELEKEEPAPEIAMTATEPSNPEKASTSDCHHADHVTAKKPPKRKPINGSPAISQLWSIYPSRTQQSALPSILPLPSLQASFMPPVFYPVPVYLPYPFPFPPTETEVVHFKSSGPKRKIATQNTADESTQERHGGWHQKWDKQKQNDTDEYPVKQNIFKEWKGNWQNRTHFKEKLTKTTTTTTTTQVPTISTDPTLIKLSTTDAETTTTKNDFTKKHFLILDEWKQKLSNRTEKFNENSTEGTIDNSSSTTKGYEKHKIIDAWKEKWFGHADKNDTLTDINPTPTPSVRLATDTDNLANESNDTIIIKAL